MESRRKRRLRLAQLARATEESFNPQALGLLQKATTAAEHHDDAQVGELMSQALAMAADPGPRFDEHLDQVGTAWLEAQQRRPRRPRSQNAAEVVLCSAGGASLMKVSSVGKLRSLLPPTGGLIIVVQSQEAAPIAKSILGDSVLQVESKSPMVSSLG